MIRKIWNGVRGRVANVAAVVAVAAVVMVLNSQVLLAQGGDSGPTEVSYRPLVEFGSVFDSLYGPVGIIVAGALGLGIAVFIARYMFGVLKGMAR